MIINVLSLTTAKIVLPINLNSVRMTVRQGNNLQITLTNGEKLILENYFEAPRNLVFKDGMLQEAEISEAGHITQVSEISEVDLQPLDLAAQTTKSASMGTSLATTGLALAGGFAVGSVIGNQIEDNEFSNNQTLSSINSTSETNLKNTKESDTSTSPILETEKDETSTSTSPILETGKDETNTLTSLVSEAEEDGTSTSTLPVLDAEKDVTNTLTSPVLETENDLNNKPEGSSIARIVSVTDIDNDGNLEKRETIDYLSHIIERDLNDDGFIDLIHSIQKNNAGNITSIETQIRQANGALRVISKVAGENGELGESIVHSFNSFGQEIAPKSPPKTPQIIDDPIVDWFYPNEEKTEIKSIDSDGDGSLDTIITEVNGFAYGSNIPVTLERYTQIDKNMDGNPEKIIILNDRERYENGDAITKTIIKEDLNDDGKIDLTTKIVKLSNFVKEYKQVTTEKINTDGSSEIEIVDEKKGITIEKIVTTSFNKFTGERVIETWKDSDSDGRVDKITTTVENIVGGVVDIYHKDYDYDSNLVYIKHLFDITSDGKIDEQDSAITSKNSIINTVELIENTSFTGDVVIKQEKTNNGTTLFLEGNQTIYQDNNGNTLKITQILEDGDKSIQIKKGDSSVSFYFDDINGDGFFDKLNVNNLAQNVSAFDLKEYLINNDEIEVSKLALTELSFAGKGQTNLTLDAETMNLLQGNKVGEILRILEVNEKGTYSDYGSANSNVKFEGFTKVPEDLKYNTENIKADKVDRYILDSNQTDFIVDVIVDVI